MANRGEVQHIVIGQADVPDVPGHRYHLHLLDAARALMLLGAVAAVSAGNAADPDGDALMVLLGFVTWLLGVCILSLVVPMAARFPRADALAGAAIIASAGAALGYLFTPWN